MRKILSVLCVAVLVLSLAACGSEPKELTSTATYDDCVLVLSEGTERTTGTGEHILRVAATYTNNGAEPLYAYCSFNVAAFQNDVELDDVSDINGNEESLIREVKNGKSLTVYYVFKLSDSSPVEVLVRTPTADTESIGRKVYLEQTAE